MEQGGSTIIGRTIEYIHGNLIPLGLIAGGTVFMQYHGGLYWADLAGPVTGWLAMGIIDIGALWLWYRRGFWLIPALAMTAILVGTAGWQIAAPLRQEMARREASAIDTAQTVARAALRVSILRDEIAGLEISLETFLRNSRRRTGWRKDIRSATKALAERRAALRASAAASAPRAASAFSFAYFWRAAAENYRALLTLAALLAIELLRVAAVFWLSRRFGAAASIASSRPVGASRNTKTQPAFPAGGPSLAERPSGAPGAPGSSQSGPGRSIPQEQERVAVNEAVPINDLAIRRLQIAIKERIERDGISAAEWCRERRIHKRDLSYLFNHFQRSSKGKQTLSPRKIHELAERFLSADRDAK